MRTAIASLMLLLGACSSSNSGPAACVAAGGQCVIGVEHLPEPRPAGLQPEAEIRALPSAASPVPCRHVKSNDAGSLCGDDAAASR